MRNTTLETEKNELEGVITRLRRQRLMGMIFSFIGLLLVIVFNFPDATEAILSDWSFISHVLCVVMTVLLVKFMG